MEIISLAVHPAYWRRGHGERLVRWCVELSNMDKVPLVISASPMGAKLVKRLGFREVEIVPINGYQDHPESIDICFAIGPKWETEYEVNVVLLGLLAILPLLAVLWSVSD